jgi:16S rRNA (cytidine1402-2'-O)-methyltransferase
MYNKVMKEKNNNILYVVSLPIGNMEDITYRAVNILKSVNTIYCEDTRQFQKYINKFSIKCKIDSYYDHIEREKSFKIIEDLKKKENYQIALVSDGGTPMISDPGYHLIKECHINNIKVIPVPGVSAVTCGLSVCPFNSSDFRFIGFFNKDKINIIKNSSSTIVFFESPKRINETLKLLENIINDRKVFIGREMTKTYETYYYFNLSHIPIIEELGEFIIMIEGGVINELSLLNFTQLKKYNHLPINPKTISDIFAEVLNIKRNKIYDEVMRVMKN